MKNAIHTIGYGTLMGLMACQAPQTENRINPLDPPQNETVETNVKRTRKIQLAILLDTSGSMNGLIEQTKNQLWQIVNQLALAKDTDGNDPEIELALYQYGNDGLNVMNGYVQQISGFTTELDEISEQLFALHTNGGSEYCGTVIQDALDHLEWTDSNEDLHMVFIAGNEEFTQGLVDFRKACQKAVDQDVIVNTIFCGNYNTGVRTFWKDGADIALGKYMNIDHNDQIKHIESPYDQELSQLNVKLNDTYIPYGTYGATKKEKQIREDANASSLGSANAAKRYISKGGKVYKNGSWDLVDASDRKDFDIQKIKMLPPEMRTMTNEEKLAYIQKLKAERNRIQSEITALSKKRKVYVANEKLKDVSSTTSQLEDVMVQAIVSQAESKSFYFEK
ncbi:VWA domain-containing protein [bacterium SCSIO 12643]|nr:VWA domain-containing protein [bacterium SCSIO 12643]